MPTFKAIVFNGHLKSDGTSNIKIRIYHNGDNQYLPTPHYIEPKLLGKNGLISELHPSADELNFDITELIQLYRKTTIKLGTFTLNRMSCQELKKYLSEVNNSDSEVIDFVKFSNSIIKKTKKPNTASWYTNSLNALKTLFGKEVIDAREITGSKLNELMLHLYERGLEPGTVNNYLRGIRALFNRCKRHYNNDDLQIIRIQHEPFSRVKIPAYRRKKKNVTIDVLKKIRDAKCATKRVELARDYFMMQFYLMGINASDLYFLNPPENGRVEYKRIKTDTETNLNAFVLSIKIEPELQVLFEKYSTTGFLSEIKAYSTNRSLLSVLNKGLKTLCENLKLPNVSTNWSRHTWASLARNKAGISKDDIDFCLGHVSTDHAMADIYIEMDYPLCHVANRKVLDLLKYFSVNRWKYKKLVFTFVTEKASWFLGESLRPDFFFI